MSLTYLESFSSLRNVQTTWSLQGLPGGSDGKESTCNAGDLGLIPRSVRSPGEGNGNPLQCSCLENPMERGVWRATVHGVTRVGHNLATKPQKSPDTPGSLEGNTEGPGTASSEPLLPS